MLESLGLSAPQLELIRTIAFQLSEIPGIAAVVLGGSWARGTARPDSDLDIGLYYSEKSPPEIERIRAIAAKASIPDNTPIVTGFYEWGPWVNGGAWIHTPAGKMDLLYRNSDQVCRVLDECAEGIYHHDFYQQPTFGFVSVVYLAETKSCLPLSDPQHLLFRLKRRVEIYPSRLQEKLITKSLWAAEFTFLHASGFAERGDIFNTVGCLGRIAFMLAQAIFAINSEYYFGDKGSMEAIEGFKLQPDQFSKRLQGVLALPMANAGELQSAHRQMRALWKEVVNLTEGRYVSRF
jgi:hypothetical protein